MFLIVQILLALVLSGCVDHANTEAGVQLDSDHVDIGDMSEVDAGSDLGVDQPDDTGFIEAIDPFAWPYPYPDGYLCDEPGMVAAKRSDRVFEIPDTSLANPGPQRISEIDLYPSVTHSLKPSADAAVEYGFAIWRHVNGDLMLHLSMWMGEPDTARVMTHMFLMNGQPIQGRITYWDAERTMILGEDVGHVIEDRYQTGDHLQIDFEIPSDYLSEDHFTDLEFIQITKFSHSFRTVVGNYTLFNGTYSSPEHPCFQKTMTVNEFAEVMTEEQRWVAEQQAEPPWPFFHLLMYTELNVDDAASAGIKTVNVGERDRVTVHILGYPTSASQLKPAWSAESIIPVLNNTPLDIRWNVAFPKVPFYKRGIHFPVWAASFEVELPPGDSELYLLTIDDPFLARADHEARLRNDGRFVFFPRTSVIRFVRDQEM